MLLLSVAVSTGLPTSTELEFKDDEKCCVSKVSQVLATSLLKSNIDIDGNQVHSPLGISTILAILAEGAAGQTYEEFQHVLGYPKNKEALRSSFKSLLEKYQNREENTQNPSFQTWLYIYRNYSAREEFKEIVSKNYYVDVKDISRSDYDWNEPNTSLDLSISSTSNSKDVIGFETLKRINVDDDEDTRKLTDNYGVEIVDKESSKFDRVVDDKQYVEKPVIIEEMKEDNITPVSVLLASEDQNSSIKDKREEEINLEENETVHDDEKIRKYNENVEKLIIPIKEVLESNEPEKLSLPLEKLENESDGSNSKEQSEMMMALESHITSVRQVSS